MELRCLNEECDSEFFTPDDGQMVVNVDGEIVSYPARDDGREPWIKDMLENWVVIEWVSVRGVEYETDERGGSEEEVIAIEDFRCLECGSEVGFIAWSKRAYPAAYAGDMVCPGSL